MVIRFMVVVLVYVILCTALGRLMYGVARVRPDRLGYAGMPLLGAFAMGVQLWAFGLAHVPWNLLTLLAPWLVGGLIAYRSTLEVARSDYHRIRAGITALRELDWLSWILIVGALLLAFTYLTSLVTQPLAGWDALAIWSIKAKIFANHQAVDLTDIATQFKRHLDYPPLFPLITDTFYVLTEHVEDIAGKAVNFVFLVSAGASVYAVLRDVTNRSLAIIFMFLVVALPIFQPFLLNGTYMGYADYALSVCILLSIANLHSAANGGGWVPTLMAVVFASMAALVKNEGLPLLGLVIVWMIVRVLLDARKGRRRPAIPLATVVLMLASLAPIIVWQLWARAHGFHSDLTTNRDMAGLLRQLPVRQMTIDHFLKGLPARTNDYGWLAAGFLLSMVLMLVNRMRYGSAVLAVILVQLGIYDLVFLFTPYDLTWHLSTAMDRVILQMTPALVLLLAISFAPYATGFAQLSRTIRQGPG